jgi:hypothetical protein
MTSEGSGRYLTIQALEWFDSVKDRLWSWLFDEAHDYKRITAIASFILGAVVMHIEPNSLNYAGFVAGALIILAFLVGCLIPIALLLEWALRKAFGR